MIFKGSQVVNRRKLHHKMTELQRAGKTETEIAEILGITSSTARYITSIFLTDDAVEGHGWRSRVDHRPRLAYEMRRAGKSFAEIGQALNLSTVRVHQLVHKYEWILSRSERKEILEH